MAIGNLTVKNFQAYDYKTTDQILKQNYIFKYPKQQRSDKVLVLCIGVNGSGKSTYLANLYKNSDFNLPYFNADILSQMMPDDKKNFASQKATELAFKLVEQGQSFCFESVFTHPSKMELVQKAKSNGYKIIGIYVYTSCCEINKKRVQDRVAQGGHNVDPKKIEERFEKMKNAICGLIEKCDELYFYGNSKEQETVKEKNKENEKVGRDFC